MSVQRNAFKLFVSILDAFSPDNELMKKHVGFPIDNVIQIKLNKESFTNLFKDANMSTSASDRYQSAGLLTRLEDFFDRTKYSNHNNLASDVTILINNSYNDVDVNPVSLETACAKNGAVFDYFFKSNAAWDGNGDGTSTSISGEDTSYGGSSGVALKVYELICQELDNMISRNVLSTSEDGAVPDNSYDDLDNLYTIGANNFWNELQVGDSIFIEGSFNVPTAQAAKTYNSLSRDSTSASYDPVGSGNLPVILQFVYSTVNSYEYNPAA